MYLCICNAINQRQARSHSAALGAVAQSSVADFYRTLGVKPKCGKCAREVRALLLSGSATHEMPAPECSAT